jgi:propanol-preferring alcohol dehydrogenase
MAEYMLVPHSRLLHSLGELDPRDAAPLSDAALTPYHAIKRSLHLLVPGSTAVVIGVGGLGHMAVQILRALSPAQVIAVDTSPEKLAVAREVGADETVEPGEEAAERIRELTGGRGAELVLDHVGADDTLALASAITRFEAHLTVVGLAGGKLEFTFGALPFESQLTIPYWGSAVELMEVLDLARAGMIRAHTERFPLDRVEDAYARMREGTLDGRAVICPHG